MVIHKIYSNLDSKTNDNNEEKIFKRVINFIEENLNIPAKKNIVLSEVEYKKNSLYGLALLPDIISPFPDDFKYELAIAKNIIKKQIDEIFDVDPRQDYWLKMDFKCCFLLNTFKPLLPKSKTDWQIGRYVGN